jgi:hypothetical protein
VRASEREREREIARHQTINVERQRERRVCVRERDSEREKGRQRESERYLKRGVYLGRLLPRHLEDHTVTKARTLLPCLLLLEVV